MPYKFNVFTGTLDIVNPTSSGGGISRIGSTTDKSITRWVADDSDTVQGSNTKVQDSGAIEAQSFITNRRVTGTVTVPDGSSWIAPNIEMQPGGVIILEPDAQLILV